MTQAQVYTWYHLLPPENNFGLEQSCELDHLVPLGLGGSDAIENIWPQCGSAGALLDDRHFRKKDMVEEYLTEEVKSGAMDLRDAQVGVAADWTKYLAAAYEWYKQKNGLTSVTSEAPNKLKERSPGSPLGRLKLDLKVSVGDLLTSFSVLLSAAGLIIAWSNDQELQRRQQADQIRNAASLVLSQLERWQEISLYALDSYEETTIKISHYFHDSHESRADIRDNAWDEIEKAALNTETREFDEQLEGAYVSLYAFNVSLKPMVEQALSDVRDHQAHMFNDFEAASEAIISSANVNAASADAAVVRNPMRAEIAGLRLRHSAILESDLKPLGNTLAKVVNAPDDVLVSGVR
jgi:hypothetical protein